LLAQLDDRALKDIGLTRLDALQEAHRPDWDIPEHRSNSTYKPARSFPSTCTQCQ
jgi:hypothetical protein